jgi:hypothetical protein
MRGRRLGAMLAAASAAATIFAVWRLLTFIIPLIGTLA